MAKPLATLGHVLREQLELRAAKAGCRQGGCGICTVTGRRRAGAVVPAAGGERRGPVGEDFGGVRRRGTRCSRSSYERFAVQCGFCAPGMLIAARALLDRNPSPTREEIAEALVGNVCRCTGYQSIIDAIAEAGGMSTLSQQPFHVVGRGVARRDGMGHVTGTHRVRRRRPLPRDAASEDGAQPAPSRAASGRSICRRPRSSRASCAF